jgi:hypothetical protein
VNEHNRPKTRKRSIHVRYSSPSRAEIVIVVAQIQDDFGRWLVPTITTSGAIPQIMESGRFASDLGQALLVASYFHDLFMMDVVDHE